MSSIFWFVVIAGAFCVYLLPALVAAKRQHNNAAAITMLNLFLGWTFLGWVVALVWASTKDVKDAKGLVI